MDFTSGVLYNCYYFALLYKIAVIGYFLKIPLKVANFGKFAEARFVKHYLNFILERNLVESPM